jgi:molecular chaperone DnaK
MTAGDWQLGIDFGTSYTVAAISTDSATTVLEIESNGQTRMPSSVFVTEDGEILVGSAAQHQAVFAPERYEATPKRCLTEGEIFLGDDLVPVVNLIAGVLRRVYVEACRQRGETLPAAVRLTHPAEWGQGRLDLLLEAAQRAGLPEVVLVPEPVAAAVWIAGTATEVGELVAVYDFGGGTFDAAVLRRVGTAFEVAGPPAGRDPLGGEDIDRHIIEHIGRIVSEQSPEEWRLLLDPPDVNWRRRAAAFRMEVQRAKETLSEVNACQLWLPGLERELQLTRGELEGLISADLDLCTDTLLTALDDAGVTPEQLHGLYLVGGSSRIPLVAQTLWRRLGVRPSVQDSPKSVVALGAARWSTAAPGAGPEANPSERSVVTIADAAPTLSIERADAAGRTFLPPVLGINLPAHLANWRESLTAHVLLDRTVGGPATVRLREESSRGRSAAEVAARAGAIRASRSHQYVETGVWPTTVLGLPGLERRFVMTTRARRVDMVERYVVWGDRALVMAFPAEVTPLADAFALAGPWPDPAAPYSSPVSVPRPAGWSTQEELRLMGAGNLTVVSGERVELPAEPEEAWRWHRLESLLRELPEAAGAGRTAGRIFGRLPGEIVTVRWRRGQTLMMSKLGTAVASGHGFVVTVTLPVGGQSDFPMLAGLLALAPAVLA